MRTHKHSGNKYTAENLHAGVLFIICLNQGRTKINLNAPRRSGGPGHLNPSAPRAPNLNNPHICTRPFRVPAATANALRASPDQTM